MTDKSLLSRISLLFQRKGGSEGFPFGNVPGADFAGGKSAAAAGQSRFPGLPGGIGTLFHLSGILRKGHTIAEKAPPFLEALKKQVGAQVAALALLEGDELKFVSGSGVRIDDLDGFHVSYSGDMLWEVIRTGKLVFKNLTVDREKNHLRGFLSLLASDLPAYAIIPLVAIPDTTIGLVFLGFSTRQSFPKETEELFKAVSNMAGNAFKQILTTDTLEKIVADRSKELNTLYQITAMVNQSGDLPEALRQALKEIVKIMGFTMGGIFLLNEDERELNMIAGMNIPPHLTSFCEHLPVDSSLEGKVIRTGEKLVCDEINEETVIDRAAGITLPLSFYGLPMRIQSRTIGVLSILGIPGQKLSLDQIALLTSIADHLALSVENYRLRKNAERSAVVEERARLAREFHDSVTQSLYSATLLSAAARQLASQGRLDELGKNLERLHTITQLSLKEMRLLVYELRSPALDEGGLLEAIRRRLSAVELRAGVEASLEIIHFQPLEVREEEELYRIVLEGLNNSLKYSNATRVNITFNMLEKDVVLSIEDNGVGFDPVEAAEKGGFGIRTMRERAEKLGGRFEIESKSGAGTRLKACIPYREVDTITAYSTDKFL